MKNMCAIGRCDQVPCVSCSRKIILFCRIALLSCLLRSKAHNFIIIIPVLMPLMPYWEPHSQNRTAHTQISHRNRSFTCKNRCRSSKAGHIMHLFNNAAYGISKLYREWKNEMKRTKKTNAELNTPPTKISYTKIAVIYGGVYSKAHTIEDIKMSKQQLELSKLQNGSIPVVSSVGIVLWRG